jgi:hypothetical protein
MSPMSEREVARRLRAERGPAEPPADLLARIEGEIPPAIAVSPHLSAAGAGALSAARRRRWLLAASLLATVGAGGLGWHLMQELPMGSALARREWGGRAEAPQASRPASRPPGRLSSPNETSVRAELSPPAAVQPMAAPDVPKPLQVPAPKPWAAAPGLEAGGQARGVPADGLGGQAAGLGQPVGQEAGPAAGQAVGPMGGQPAATGRPNQNAAVPDGLGEGRAVEAQRSPAPGQQQRLAGGGPSGEKLAEKIEAAAESPLLGARTPVSGDKERARTKPAVPDAARKSAQAQAAPAPSASAPSVQAPFAPAPSVQAKAAPPSPPPPAPFAPSPPRPAPPPAATPPAEAGQALRSAGYLANSPARRGERGAVLEITVEHAGGGPLSGVIVQVAGAASRQQQPTDASGRAVFAGLAAGPYAVRAELPGYLPFTRSRLEVDGGQSLRIRLLPLPATGIEARRLPAELDIATGASVSSAELAKIPTAGEDVLDRLRRDLDAGRLPRAGTVPVAELVNAFDYGDPLPAAAADAMRRTSSSAGAAPASAWLGAEGAMAPAAGAGRRARLRFSMREPVLPAGAAFRVAFAPRLVARYREAGTTGWVSARRPALLALPVHPQAATGGGMAASWLFEVDLAGGGGSSSQAGTAPLATLSLALPGTATVAARALLPGELAPSWQAAPVNLRIAFLAADFAAELGGAAGRGGRQDRSQGAAAGNAAGAAASVDPGAAADTGFAPTIAAGRAGGAASRAAAGAAAARDLAARARALAAAFPGDPRVAELARLTARAAELRAKAAATP